jgi:cellulose synthase/poly-beta-1,6-N-acetylglucosamine synthase-like glycosyltransferase
MEIVGFVLPSVSVLVPMHNEERVAADVLQALVDSDYRWDKLQIIAINDGSTDRTGEIIDQFAARYSFIRALHRRDGGGGKPAALAEATPLATGDVILLFDADYVPSRSMIKFLVAPFADPEIGAVMGRVIPHNAGESLLAALLSLERAAGYQCAQQSRYNLGFTAQFGGTVGGVRSSALAAAGGWNAASLTEDTDLTFALLLRGWRTAYVNRAECYEEVPKSWLVRRRQLVRWVTGHTECLHRYWKPVLEAPFLSRWEKADALLLLGLYLTAPIMVAGWFASVLLFFTPAAHEVPVFAVAILFLGYQLLGNQASFAEIGVASLLDGTARRALLLPLNLLNFFASTVTTCAALIRFYWSRSWSGPGPGWDKTTRTRLPGRGPNGDNAGSAFARCADGTYYMHPARRPLPHAAGD